MNKIIEKLGQKPSANTTKLFRSAKELTEKFVEEVFVEGFKPQLIEEGKMVCENICRTINRDKKLVKLLDEYLEKEESSYQHAFLVSVLSVATCKNIEWSSSRTEEIISFGSLFHDIGLLRLSPDLKESQIDSFDEVQMEQFKQHPKMGAEMLVGYNVVTEPVRQLVYQHHEHINGDGFPNGLPGIRIYPLAKVISFVDAFANYFITQKVAPIKGLQLFLYDRELMSRFDSQVVMAFLKGFTGAKIK